MLTRHETLFHAYRTDQSWPLQFLRTGLYNRSYGDLNNRSTNGYWWSDTVESATDGRRLSTHTGIVNAQGNGWRGNGFALRCVENELIMALQVQFINNRDKTITKIS